MNFHHVLYNQYFLRQNSDLLVLENYDLSEYKVILLILSHFLYIVLYMIEYLILYLLNYQYLLN